VTVTSILSKSALATYAAAKSRINSIGSQLVDDTHQNEVERLLNALSAAAEQYCGRRFGLKARTELYAPPRGERLQLDQFPIAAYPAPSAELDGSAITCEIEDAELGWLRADGGWTGATYEEEIENDGAPGEYTASNATRPGSAEHVLAVTYTAGWVLPQDVAGHHAWTGTHAFTKGEIVKSSDLHRFAVCTTAGTSANTEPTWLDRVNMEVTDGTVVWQMLEELPLNIEEAILIAVTLHWKMRQAGFADYLNEMNTAIGRGRGGLIPDALLPAFDAYRRIE